MEPSPQPEDELRPEYDLTQLRGGVRGKHFAKYRAQMHLVRIADDLTATYPTEDAVNDALRRLSAIERKELATNGPARTS